MTAAHLKTKQILAQQCLMRMTLDLILADVKRIREILERTVAPMPAKGERP